MSESDKDQWFVVHVLSGQEQKVYENLTRRIKKEEMGDLVYEVLIPTERVSEIKRGKRTETTRKFFPGILDCEYVSARQAEPVGGPHLVFYPRNSRGIGLCRNQGSSGADAAARGGKHVGPDPRAGRQGQAKGQF